MSQIKTSMCNLYMFADEIRDGKYKNRDEFKWAVFDSLVAEYQKESNIIFLDMPEQNDADTLTWIDQLEKEYSQ